jgi:hypothetical protein
MLLQQARDAQLNGEICTRAEAMAAVKKWNAEM